MIEDFYGFSAVPFSLSPDARFFFDSRGHKTALSYLRFGLQQGEGFIVITGEIGAGKSTLINRLLDELDRNATEVAYITTSNVNADDVLRLIAGQFGIVPKSEDKAALLRALEGYMTTQRRMGRRVLVIIDEAQNLPMGTIEELRMLSNLTVDGQSAIQCFLVGQPQFKAILSDPDMEQLRQRVIASYHLGTLTEDETRNYIEHRMQVVGWTGRPNFTDDAYAAIYRATAGVPRRINNVCSRMLMHGAIEELEEIDGPAAEEILGEMGTEVAESAMPPSRSGWSAYSYGNSGQALPASNSALEQTVAQLSQHMREIARTADTLERNQSTLSQSISALRNLESRIAALEDSNLEGEVHRLAETVQESTTQLHVLDSRLSESLGKLPSEVGDVNAVQQRLALLEEAMTNGTNAPASGQDEHLAKLDRDVGHQSEILQELLAVTMTLLGHRGGQSVDSQPVKAN